MNMYRIMIPRPPLGQRLAMISYEPDHHLRGWMRAARFSEDPEARPFAKLPPLPVRAEIEPAHAGAMQDLIEAPLPLMSARLRQAMLDAGVHNIDFYPAEISDRRSGNVITDYFAFNIVGKIAAADLATTVFAPENEARMISADIDALGIDQAKGGGALVFRLAESVNAIVVHEQVQRQIDSANIDGVAFADPQEWAG
jgi:hypothetical protein